MRTGDRIPRVGVASPMTEAIHEMSRKMMGVTAIVEDGGGLYGVISDGDLRRLLERDPNDLKKTAGACCRLQPKTVAADEFASAALDLMRSHKITSLFVVEDGGRLVGAIHMHDLLSAGL